MTFKFSKSSIKNMQGVKEPLIKIAERALEISNVDFGVPFDGGYRDEITQHNLFIKGRSKADGRYKKSKHQSGDALDFFAYVDGKATWDIVYMSQVASAFLQAAIDLDYKIQWGGLLKNFQDLPHIELKDS